ncbi:hypothetical protein SprV_0100098300 [Sparganum proliferum]
MNGTESVEIERALVVEDLPLRAESTIKRIASSWPQLSGIMFDELTNCEVGILIGNDIAEAHWVVDQRLGGKREPFAVKTLLGWMLLGSSRGRQKQNAVCHCIVNQEKDVTHSIKKLYDSEFSDTSTTTASHSLEDKRALAIVRSSVTIIKGHYQLPLPWRNSTLNLPDSFQLARKRLTYLKSKLGRDPELLRKYEQTFRSYMEKGYIERVDGNKAFPVTRHWYLPHHPVVNPRKPRKIRVVFDCAAKCQGVSLNDNLYQGPDLNAKLVSVLLGFRLERIAVAGDIQEMFLQVKVGPIDRPALKFLWWENDDLEGEPVEFQWTSHPFELTSSPFCATFALQKTVEDFSSSYSPSTCRAIHQSIYVDDCLISLCDVDSAKRFVDEIRKLLSQGGFRMRNWASNDRRILSVVSATERSSGMRDIAVNPLPTERT